MTAVRTPGGGLTVAELEDIYWRVEPEAERSTRPVDSYDVIGEDTHPVNWHLTNLTFPVANAIAEAHNQVVTRLASHEHPSREDLARRVHRAEMVEWPLVSADPNAGCLGMDRCLFVAAAVLTLLDEGSPDHG